MLIPRRTNHRKQHRPDRSGAAKGGTRATFGEYGIQALQHSYVSNRQVQPGRIAMTRHIRRRGNGWIAIYPDPPLTQIQAATGQLESHGRLRAVRKEIARIYTVMRERELGIVTLEQEAETDE